MCRTCPFGWGGLLGSIYDTSAYNGTDVAEDEDKAVDYKDASWESCNRKQVT
jgi:hypothetical protein